MFHEYLAYIILWILFQLLVEINCQMTPFKPTQRTSHTATVIDNKLYISDGYDPANNIIGKGFFYLDVSVPFNTQNLLWQDLSSIDIVPPHGDAASVGGGANNNTLFLYGGSTTDPTMALVYAFDPQSNTWSTPKITGISNIRRRSLTGIMDNNGKMYLWGGIEFINGKSANIVNYMEVLDTINLNWGQGSLVGAPTARFWYGAVLLPNNNIIYMGGSDNAVKLSLNQVYIYDTINNIWSVKATIGTVPSPRDDFSVVLGLDGQRIIIFGGRPAALLDPLYVLNLINFEWYIPKTAGQAPKSRNYHRVNLIGNYMVISFGNGYDPLIESDILLLDISNNDEYVWTNTFVPLPSSNSVPLPSATQSANSPTSPQQSNKPKISSPTSPQQTDISSTQQSNKPNKSSTLIISATLGSLFGILFPIGFFLLYRRNKNNKNKKQKDIIRIHGNTNYNIYNHGNEKNIHNHGQEVTQVPRNENTTNHEPTVIDRNYNHGQEIIQIHRNEVTTNHEPIIPSSGMNRNYNHGQEIIQISRNEDTTNNDSIVPASEMNRNYNHGHEIIQIPRNEVTTNHEPIIPDSEMNRNYNHGEIIQMSRNEDTTNHEPLIDRNYNHGQEIAQIPRNENTTNHEPIIPASEIDRNYNHGQEEIPNTNNERFSSQDIDYLTNILRQEIQNLRQEFLQNNVQTSVSNNNNNNNSN
ncbi:hypothetical protein C1645_814913 [Glomus cerebriforme]|uniref:Galactose oxidase n=1 Tax=Glomus cerebriforme TaxID=658196 RepID=A0A397TEP7_9GLOM|nr:hypothetical protein C1645_814913 [Glomus cerebriforme]